MAYTSFVFLLGTVSCGFVHYLAQMAYVFHRGFPGGPTAYGGSILIFQAPWAAAVMVALLSDWVLLGVQVSLAQSQWQVY
jgi:hypothetical protein